MSLAEEFNRLSRRINYPRLTVQSLTSKDGYKVLSLKSAHGKYGRFVVALVNVPERPHQDGTLYDVFLPARFSEVLSSRKIAEYNSSDQKQRITYLGIGEMGENIVTMFPDV